MPRSISPRTALIVFLVLVLFVFAQAVWWIIFMAKLADEKVEIAEHLNAGATYVEQLHEEEISRQVMLGLEGTVFLLLLLVGIWLIYRALLQAEALKRNQENFLMAVTHELKTPIASMKLYLDTLSSERIPPEKKTAVLPRMKQDASRLERMVENILEAGRAEQNPMRPERRSHKNDPAPIPTENIASSNR